MRKLGVVLLVVALAQCSASAGGAGRRAGSIVHDAYLIAAARAKLVGVDPDSATHVGVSLNHGLMTLRGAAKSMAERAQYVAAVASISGVRGVRDDMTVDPHIRGISEQTKDAVLEIRVSAAIASQAGTNVFHVSTSAHNGFITLRGTVPSALEKRIVARTARSVSGVRGVADDLTIRG